MASNSVNFDLQLAVNDFQRSLNTANGSIKGFSDEFKKNTQGNSQAWNSFVGTLGAEAVATAASVVMGLARSLGDFGLSTIKAAGDLEKMTVELGALLGSATLGRYELMKLQDFANKTPFELPGIVNSAKLLTGFGVTLKEMPDLLNVLGNIAAGTGKPLEELAMIFGRVQAETKLNTRTLNELNNAGINIGPSLAKNLHIPLSQLRKTVEDGKVSFDMFNKALVAIQAPGGVFADGMIKQSKSLDGILSTMRDSVRTLLGAIGDSLLPTVKNAVNVFITLTEWLTKNSDVVINTAKSVGLAAAAFGAYAVYANAATIATRALAIAQALTPWGLIIAGVAGLSAGIYFLITRWDALKLKTLEVVASILETVAPLGAISKKLFNFDVTGTVSALDYIKGKIKETNDSIAKSNRDTQDKNKEGATLEAAKIKEQTQIKTDALRAEQAEKRRISDAIQAEDISKLQTMGILEEEGAVQRRTTITNNANITAEEKQIRNEAEIQELYNLEQRKIDIALEGDLAKAAQELSADARKKAIKEANFKAELARTSAHVKNLNDTQASVSAFEKKQQEDRVANQASTLSTIATLSKSSNKELALLGKAAGIAQIAIDTPVAIGKAMAAFAPPFNFIAAGLVGAAMAVQAANIAGLNFAQGGFVPGNSFSGDNVRANVNSGEAILNSSQQRNFMAIANGQGGSSDALISRLDALEAAILNRPVVLIANDTEIARSASRGVMNGIQIGRNR